RLAGVVTGDIEVGAGKLQLHVPSDVGVRLKCDVGLGNLRINGQQYGRQGLGAHETWESANYAGASVRLDLRVEAGTGSIEVTTGR
ncbi:MAG TPA: LiaF-related protein, partial [Bacillota bacterium]|nr:LiaF-related protein [Bacillota bacterium]